MPDQAFHAEITGMSECLHRLHRSISKVRVKVPSGTRSSLQMQYDGTCAVSMHSSTDTLNLSARRRKHRKNSGEEDRPPCSRHSTLMFSIKLQGMLE